MLRFRDRESRQTHGSSGDLDFMGRVNYLREHRVQSVLSGVINMRKRQGKNWFSILRADPAGANVGHGIIERFETLTLITTATDKDRC